MNNVNKLLAKHLDTITLETEKSCLQAKQKGFNDLIEELTSLSIETWDEQLIREVVVAKKENLKRLEEL